MAIDKKKKEVKTVVKIVDKEEKQKALDTAIAYIEKQFGAGAIMKLGDSKALDVEAIPTGSMTLDMALGIGGIPRGRIVEIYGPESSGKTTVALHCIAQAQRAGGEVAFIDVEHALDPVYAEKLGVDIDSMLVSQPDSGEQALEIAEALARSGSYRLYSYRLSCGNGNKGGNRRGNGRYSCRTACKAYVAGNEKAYLCNCKIKLLCDLYQSGS